MPAERVGSSRERIYLAGGNKRRRRRSAGRHGIHNRGSCHGLLGSSYAAVEFAGGHITMADDFPLSILDHRISTLRDKIHEMHGKLASLMGEERTKLSEHIAAEAKELDGLVAERDILAADTR